MDIELDFDVYRWKLSERIAFEKVAGMTCERALSLFAAVGEGDAVNEEAALDIPALVQAAFVWIVARRQKPGMTFDEAAEMFDGMAFLDAIPEEDEAPLAAPNRAARRSTKKSSAPSATTSITRPAKSST